MPKNIRVFMDFTIGSKAAGRVVFELFYDITPLTAENFRGLCFREETSRDKMALEVIQSTQANSRTKTSNEDMPTQEYFQWLTVAKTQMLASSSSL